MRIGQLILKDASFYERKSQALDAISLAEGNQILVWIDRLPRNAGRVDLIHVYGPATIPADVVREITAPYVATGTPRKGRFMFKDPVSPARRMPATGAYAVPEAVDDSYFTETHAVSTAGRYRIGSFGKSRRILPMIKASITRLARFRDDIDWEMFDTVPSAAELSNLHLWVDPVIDEADLDGMVAESLVAGVPVVAARTEMNHDRLAEGRAGFLVPMNDPNELVHAILVALFKPEIRDPRLEFAAQTRARFRRENRARRLRHIYAEVAR